MEQKKKLVNTKNRKGMVLAKRDKSEEKRYGRKKEQEN